MERRSLRRVALPGDERKRSELHRDRQVWPDLHGGRLLHPGLQLSGLQRVRWDRAEHYEVLHPERGGRPNRTRAPLALDGRPKRRQGNPKAVLRLWPGAAPALAAPPLPRRPPVPRSPLRRRALRRSPEATQSDQPGLVAEGLRLQCSSTLQRPREAAPRHPPTPSVVPTSPKGASEPTRRSMVTRIRSALDQVYDVPYTVDHGRRTGSETQLHQSTNRRSHRQKTIGGWRRSHREKTIGGWGGRGPQGPQHRDAAHASPGLEGAAHRSPRPT